MLSLVRRFLAALEPVAPLPWFSPEFFEEMAPAGFEGWSAYFCSRAAPLGPVPAEAAIALFYNWNPAMIRRELQWDRGTPEAAWDAYLRGTKRAFERALARDVSVTDIARAASLLRMASDACPLEGRPVFAAYTAKPWPDDPMLQLWFGATLLREFRGDTHNAVLVSHGLGPIDALLLNANWIEADGEKYLASREWTMEDAKPYIEALKARAFFDDDGRLTDGGAKFREMVELDTDRRSSAPVEALGEEQAEEALALIEPIAKRLLESRAVPGIVGRISRRAGLK